MVKNKFDVIIIGGSYSGLSAAMALGRALRNVLVIDNGKPCNLQTPHSHNFITQDGKTPAQISSLAKEQVRQYPTIQFYDGLAISGQKVLNGFEITTQSGEVFFTARLLFATGVKDIMPDINGFAACWGISVIHCPYCHGYEVRNEPTGILANGDMAFEIARLIHHWTKELTLFTNGASTLTVGQTRQLQSKQIKIIEKDIACFDHANGYVQQIIFQDGSSVPLTAIYTRPSFEQHCSIPCELGCGLTEHGHLIIDGFQKTTVAGIFACGDNTSFMRAVATAVASGTLAGASLNKDMIEDSF